MGIKDHSQGANTQQTQQMNQGNSSRQQNDQGTTSGFRGIYDNGANRFGSTTSTTALLSGFQRYAEEYFKEFNQKFKLGIKTYTMTEGAVPALIVTMAHRDDVVLTHAITIVDNKHPPEPLIDKQARGQDGPIVDNTVWADAYDGVFIGLMNGVINKVEGKTINIIDCGSTALDNTFIKFSDLNDKEVSSDRLNRFLFSVMSVMDAVKQSEDNNHERSVRPEYVTPNTTIVADIGLEANTVINEAGRPIAEDFLIRISETTGYRSDDNRIPTLNKVAGESTHRRTYGSVSGRIDFTYVEPAIANPAFGAYADRIRPEDTACFIPEFIISHFDVLDMTPSLSLLMQLVASVGALDTQNMPLYLEGFKPQNIANNRYRNLGALQADMVDPATNEPMERFAFTPSDDMNSFMRFVQAAIHRLVAISIEVPTNGSLRPLLETFDRAAEYAISRKEEDEVFNTMIIEACDVLTGGAMSRHWNPSQPVMMARRAIIPTGEWIDNSQNRRDSREHGYLYYANLDSPQDAKQMSFQYDSSFAEDDQLRAGQLRRQLITEIHGAQFTQTDNVSRVWFSPEFYTALLAALDEARMLPQVNATNFAGVGRERRVLETNRYIQTQDIRSGYNTYVGQGAYGSGNTRFHNQRNFGGGYGRR